MHFSHYKCFMQGFEYILVILEIFRPFLSFWRLLWSLFYYYFKHFNHFQVFRGILIIYKFLKYFSIWMLSWCSGHLEDFKNVFMTLEIMSYCFLHVGFKRFVLLRYKRGFRFMRKEVLFS